MPFEAFWHDTGALLHPQHTLTHTHTHTQSPPPPHTHSHNPLPPPTHTYNTNTGGIIGTSILYHLSHLSIPSVLLERSTLTSGTTWHAAGLMVTFGSLSSTSTEWRKYTKGLYERGLREETGMDTGFKDVGFIEVRGRGRRVQRYI